MPSSVPAGTASGQARSGRVHVPFAAVRIASTWAREPRERLCSRSAATALRRTPHSGRSGSRKWHSCCFPEKRLGREPPTAPGRVWNGHGRRTPVRAGEMPYRGPKVAPGRRGSALAGPTAPRTSPAPPRTVTRPLAALWCAPRAAARPSLTRRPASGSDAERVAHDGCGRTHGPFPRIPTRRRGDGRHYGSCGARATRSLRRCGGLRGEMAEARWLRASLRLGTGWVPIPSPLGFSSSTSHRTASPVETVVGLASDRMGQWAAASS